MKKNRKYSEPYIKMLSSSNCFRPNETIHIVTQLNTIKILFSSKISVIILVYYTYQLLGLMNVFMFNY